jgi:hypothetical protein
MPSPFSKAEWNFSAILASSDRIEVALCRHYEYVREALLRFDPKIKLAPKTEKSATIWYGGNMLENGYYPGAIFTIWDSCFMAGIDFPCLSFLEARAKLRAQNRSENLSSYVTAEEWIPTLLQKMATRLPGTGAGALIRQQKTETDLNSLGAARLLRHLAGSDGTTRKPRSSLIYDAILYSEKALGKPLLLPEQKWQRAYRRVEEIVAGYDVANSAVRTAGAIAQIRALYPDASAISTCHLSQSSAQKAADESRHRAKVQEKRRTFTSK